MFISELSVPELIADLMKNGPSLFTMKEVMEYLRNVDDLYDVQFRLWCRHCFRPLRNTTDRCQNAKCEFYRFAEYIIVFSVLCYFRQL